MPREGYAGEAPDFPLPRPTARERALWAEAWRTPQAAAWAQEPWRWYGVGQWVRWAVKMEHRDASASLGTVVVRLADQIGLTPAGLKENGWAIAKDEVSSRRPAVKSEPGTSARDRMRVVNDAGGD